MRSLLNNSTTKVIRNIHQRPFPRASTTNPVAYFSSSSGVGVVSDVIAGDGTPGVRMTRVGTGALAMYNSRGGSSMWRVEKDNFKAGDTWTILFNFRASAPDTSLTVQIGQGSGSQSFGDLNENYVIGTELTTIRKVITFTQAHVDASGTAFLKWQPSSLAPVGDWYEVSKVAVIRGVYPADFASGDTPGWQWAGTNNASESFGYPYKELGV